MSAGADRQAVRTLWFDLTPGTLAPRLIRELGIDLEEWLALEISDQWELVGWLLDEDAA